MHSPRSIADSINAKSTGRVRSYFDSRDDWNLSRSLKNLIEQAIRDYDHRAVVELVQNAHDAQPQGARDGRVLIRLDHDEGEHGTLIVANTGLSFSPSNFDAICDVAQSDKRADEGIGNKGIGFKSTLQLCRIPEIYSAASSDSNTFDGYCFKFADEYDLQAAVNGDADKAADLVRDVFHLCLPVALIDVPVTVQQLRAEGYVTAIRLPLKSEAAREEAMEEVRGIELNPPTLLFLRRIAELVVEERNAGEVRRKTHERHERPIGSVDQRSTLTEVVLGNETKYLVAERVVDGEAFRTAIRGSVETDRISEGWSDWQGDARVGIGIPLDQPLSSGRLYTFLPMGEHATAPLPAHVNAPFFAKLARIDFEESVPLNDFLLDEIASLAAGMIVGASKGIVALPPTVVADLLSWGHPGHSRLVKAFKLLGQPIETAMVVPLRGGGWGALTDSFVWDDEGLKVFTAKALQRVLSTNLLHDSIGVEQLNRLNALAEALIDVSLHPGDEAIAEWAEALAKSSAKRKGGFFPRWWEAFYDELSSVINNPASLRGRWILIDDDLQIQRCAGSEEAKGPTPFFSPKADDVSVNSPDEDLRIPGALKRQIFFVNQHLRWTDRAGSKVTRRDGRRMLDQQKAGLVFEYRASELFGVLNRALRTRPTPARSRDALQWAYRFVRSREDPPWSEISAVAFHVPTVAGRWIPAADAFFSRAWGATEDELFDEFMMRTEGQSDELDGLRASILTAPADWPFEIDCQQSFREFLDRLGVRSGLWPRAIPRSVLSDQGNRFEDLSAHTSVPLPASTRAQWRSALALRAPSGLRPYTNYRALGPQFSLPGQAEYPGFDDTVRRLFAQLIVLGLERWEESMFEVDVRRHNDVSDHFTLPTPAAAFLAEVEWLPMARSGERQSWYFVRPQVGWSHGFGDDAAPAFAALVPHALRQLTELRPRTRQRLSKLGVQFWDAPDTAPARVRLMTELLRDGALADTATAAFRKSYEDAWEEVVKNGAANPFDGDETPYVVASRRSQLVAVPLHADEGAEPIYIQDSDSNQALHLLEQRSVPVVRLRRGIGSAVADMLVKYAGARIRRLSDTEVTVHVDGRHFAPSGEGDLLVEGRRWIVDLVTSLTEVRSGRFRRVGSEAVRRTRDTLQRIRIVLVERVETLVDGQLVHGRSRALALADATHPTIVVKHSDVDGEQQLLQAVAPAIAELIGYPDLADSIRLSLIDLAREGHLGGDGPSLAAIADVMGESEERLREISADAVQPLAELVQLLVPLLATKDLRVASDLWAAVDSFDSEEAIVSWLRARLGKDWRVGEVIAATKLGDLNAARLALDIKLRQINVAITQLGPPFELLRNPEGINQAFHYFVRRHREAILASLRTAFINDYRALAPIDGYIARRDLSCLQPDPEWVDEYYELEDTVISSYVDTWLGECGARRVVDTDTATWMPVDELRRANRARLQIIIVSARVLVRAWETAVGRQASDLLGDAEVIVELATDAGQLDFELVSDERVVAWLARVGRWPTDMPHLLDPAALGINERDFEEAKRQHDDVETHRRQAERRISIDDKQFDAEEENFAAIVDAVRASITPALLAVPPKVTNLPEMPPPGTPNRVAGARGVTAARRPRLSDIQAAAVGLAGEVVALEWLKANYDGATDASWRSGYRNLVLGGNDGDDSAGYDFEVLERSHRLLFEVKASITDLCEFDLTEGEIRAAQSLRRSDRYFILYVTHVLTGDERDVHLLPNPFGTEGLGKYRTVGSGLRLRFKLQ